MKNAHHIELVISIPVPPYITLNQRIWPGSSNIHIFTYNLSIKVKFLIGNYIIDKLIMIVL